jgi:hypothetical protein
MKRVLLLLVLLAGTALSLAAETSYTVEQVVFLPPHHYVGDRVEARIKLRADPGKTVTAPETYPVRDETIIHHVEIEKRDDLHVVRIRFSSFTVGQGVLPPLQLGDLRLHGIEYTTGSLLEEEQVGFQEIRDQLLLPGTYLLFGIMLAGIILIVLIIFPGMRLIKQWLHTMGERREKRVTFTMVMKTVDELRTEADSMSAQQFYTILCSTLRMYLHHRLPADFLSKTTTELREVLGAYCAEADTRNAISGLLEFGDKVKFGGVSASEERRMHDLDVLGSTARVLEEQGDEHVGI